MRKFLLNLVIIAFSILLTSCFGGIAELPEDVSEGSFTFTAISSGEEYAVTISAPFEEKLIIPDSYDGKPVTKILSDGDFGLESGARVIEVTLPESIKEIEADVFYGMTNIRRVNISDLAAFLSIEFASPESNPLIYAEELYLDGELLEHITVPEGVEEIKSLAFINFAGIKSLTVGNGVSKIGSRAFYDCKNLSYVELGQRLTFVDSSSFYGCDGITEFLNHSNIIFGGEIGKMDTIKVNKQAAQMIGHAGLAGIVMQNTEESFIYAAKRSYYGIETDIRKTADGNFVCFHDPDLLASAGLDMKIETSTLAEIQAVTLYDNKGVTTKEKGYRILSLAEYVNICKEYGKRAVIELKTPFSEEDVGRIIEIVDDCGYIESSTFISFYYDNLLSVRKFLPDAKVGFTFKTAGDDVESRFEKIVADGFSVNMSTNVVTKEWVDRFHEAGLQVTCYTIDDRNVAESLAEMGVDYIMTNRLE